MKSNQLLYKNLNLLLIGVGAIALYMSHKTGLITILSIYIVLIWLIVPCRKYIDSLGKWILAYTMAYTLIGFGTGFINSISTAVAYALPLPFFYFSGHYIQDKSESDRFTLYIIAFSIAFYASEIYVSIFESIVSTGNLINVSRLFYLGGEESRNLAATQAGLTISLGFIGFPMFILLKKRRLICWFYFVLFISSLLTTIHLVNRTGIVVCIFSFVFPMLYYYKKHRTQLFFIFILLLAVISALYTTGIISHDIIEAYSARNDLNFQTAGGRTERWTYALHQLLTSPFGWAESNGTTIHFVHNMWLDVAKVTGIIPFILLLVSTVKSVKTLIRLSNYPQNVVIASFIALNACFFLSCFVEPVYGGMHIFLYVMIWGMQNQYLNQISAI